MSIPEKYIPKVLSTTDEKKQKSYIVKSRRLYKQGKYYERPKVRSYKSKSSKHLENVERIYGVNPLKINKELSKQTK